MKSVTGMALSCLAIGSLVVPSVYADPPDNAQTEINFLLAYVAKAGCEFQRNGSWYDSKRAEAHLRSKYKVLKAHQIQSAEDFIEKAATESSMTGRPYEIKCDHKEPATTNKWLREALAHYRGQNAHVAPP